MQDMFEAHFKEEQDGEDFRYLSQASDLVQTTVNGLLALALMLSSNRSHISLGMLVTVSHLANDLDDYRDELLTIVKESAGEE